MNLIVNPRDQHDEAARLWLPVFVRSVYEEILPLARRCFDLPADPWEDYAGTLEVLIHPSYVPWNGGFTSGLTHWFPPQGDSKIEIAWNVQWMPGLSPLRHEFGHWLGLRAGSPLWDSFGHWDERDPLRKCIERDIETAYFDNYKVIHT